jgi:hypothetical protein
VTPIEDLMAQLGIDERVVLPESKAPPTDEERIAVLEFFDAFARGDAQSLQPMLQFLDSLQLEQMVESGEWDEATDGIEMIEIQTGRSPDGQNCALAVFTVGLEFEPQLWYYRVGDDDPEFEAAPTPPGILDQLSGDWIAAWHRVIAQELALADEMDEELTRINQNLDEEQEESGGSSASGGGGGRGSRPAPPPGRGRRKPPGTPRRPPGPR